MHTPGLSRPEPPRGAGHVSGGMCLLGVCLLAWPRLLGRVCISSSACPRPCGLEGTTLPSPTKEQWRSLDWTTRSRPHELRK